ncbi:jg18693 [Pararge aegeria aegeria]|uniref:Acyl-coenzyme A oxidase n=1 Tax=Pararge aegeria aegeria TaxID=348720 RepID=A0A8S4SKK5_9NEOP|nr:jg18693 [Pararge aegeria aegeria]
MAGKKVNEDLLNERAKCNFDVEELTNLLDDGVEHTKRRRTLEQNILSIEGLQDDIPEEYLSHKEKYENGLRKTLLMCKALQTYDKESAGRSFQENIRLNFRNSLWSAVTKDTSPLLLHLEMFMIAILEQGNEEQREYWSKKATNFEIIGTYAQVKLIFCEDVISQKKAAERDGTYKASPNSKLAYGAMVYVRVVIINSACKYLARATTIAVRYSAIRRQSQLKPNAPEPQIIDYVTQQHKLLIAISTSHAYHFTARWLWDLYTKTNQELRRGEFKNLPELHILACSMKVLSSADCTALIEKCRLACGGHGYLMSSSLPILYGVSTATVTYEGENTVLLLQVARSLVKTWDQILKGHISVSPSMVYLGNRTPLPKWDSSLQGILESFKRVAKGKVSASVSSIDQYRKSGLSPEDAWNKASVQLISAAEAHARIIVLSVYKAEIERRASTLSSPLATVLLELLELYYIYWALEKTGDLLLYTKLSEKDVRDLQHRYEDILEKIRPNAVGLVDAFDFRDEYTKLSEKDVRDLQHRYEDILEKIRPNAVGLVDAFDFRDEILSSTLGAYDGRAYERLMEEALKSPLNKEPVNQSFEKYLKPFMRGKL